MDLEKLTKHQIVLLALLVSFVTSIATGIVTVSLMDQAPTSVVRTVNQIVERTVEKVAPTPSNSAAVAAVEKTVVVKDDDLAAQSIAKVQGAIVRIAAKGGDLLLTRGVIIAADGAALVDRGSLGGFEAFEAILPGGERVTAKVRAAATSSPVALMDIAVGTSTAFAPAALADASKLRLGQSVIRIGGTGADTVGTGVIARLPSLGSDDAHGDLIEASVPSATPGSVLMTIFGEVIGIVTSDSLAASPAATLYSIPDAALLSAPAPKPSS